LPPVQVRQVLGRVRAHLSGTAHPAGTVEPKNDSDENLRIGEILLSEGNISNDDLQKALSLQNRGIGEILVAEGVVLPEKIQAALEKQHAVSDRPRGSIRVDIERLDNLMNLVGELVISQTQVADYFRKDGHFENDGEFGRNIGHLGKTTKEMQDQVMSLRMVPLRPILQKMTRVVRDVAQKSGKNVRLLLSGEDTEVDKTVNEMLNDPLVHILRNSVDHGIETPTDRKAAGKSPEGVIHLSAKHESGNIVIEISDDGKGLDKTRILRKAVEKGLVQADAQLSDSQIHQMIMSPGFSTAEKITDISGRGVGLDVVKRNIEQLRGNIEVQSTEGKGSRFTIRLPLTLAIIDGMLVLSGGNKFILPALSIIRTLQPKPEEIKAIQGKGEVISTADDLWPLIRMDRLYGLRDVPIAPADGLAVIVENHKGENYALLVDELLGQQQVVVKSLGPLIPEGMGIAGGTILADGRVGLILDLAGIPAAFQKFRNSRRAKKSLPQENAPGPEDHDALVRMSS
ncbi:MAG: ATP-binding protein, partial [bacterium]|nr:ATP-binding protein [bacterium]